MHDFAGSVEQVGEGKNPRDTFEPLGRTFEGKPDTGQKHHRPGNEIQDAGGKFFADSSGCENQAQSRQAQTTDKKN